MNVSRAVFGALRVYFWILVGASVLTLLWLLDQFVLDTGIVATGWFAIAGFGALIVVFLVVIRRAAS